MFAVGDHAEGNVLQPGQMIWTAVDLEEPPGKPLKACRLRRVVLTHIAPGEDAQVRRAHGPSAKRRQQILRMTVEAKDQQALLTQEDLAEILSTQVRTRSANAANKDRKNLLAMFGWGVKVLGLDSNPVAAIDKYRHDRKPQYTPPEGDVLKVLAAAHGVDRVFLLCYLHTGARRSEIFRLTWDDVNFERSEIRLKTRKTRSGEWREDWIPMTETLARELKWWWDNRTFKRAAHVFLSEHPMHYGKPYVVRRRFLAGLCDRAGVTPFGFHALRRYVASVLADKHKVSTKRIQEVLRHQSVHTTERYLHNLGRDLKGTMDFLDGETKTSVPQTVPQKKRG